MNLWLAAALAMLAAIAIAAAVSFRGKMADRLVGLELLTALVTLELVLLVEGLRRSIDLDLPLVLAFLSLGSGLVFARFLQRWL